MLAFNFEIQAFGRMIASLETIANSIIPKSPEEQKSPGSILGTYFEETPSGREHFFRPNETDDNGSGWDFRNGK